MIRAPLRGNLSVQIKPELRRKSGMSKRVTMILVSLMTVALALPVVAKDKVDDAYFAKFRDGLNARNHANIKAAGADVTAEWADLGVYEIKVKNPNATAALANNPNIDYVEEMPWRQKLDLATTQ